MGEAITGNQERNIMILFLSNFFPKDTGEGVKTLDRKFEGIYKFHDGTMDSEACTLTNEAPIRDVVASLSHQNRKLDKIVYFVTSALQEEPVKLLDGGRIQEYKTKEDLFLHRIREKCRPALDDTEFVGVPFDDKSNQPMQECIEAVVRMENEIKKNLLTEDKERNHLFADITGGLRTANMAMTAVIQLLQYEKIQVDLVLYSYSSGDIRSVLDVRDVDSLYKLVAGVDAFTKYGSSAALNEYFADVINDKVGYQPLKKMLFVMDKFSASVLLCQTNLIKKNLAKLMRRLYKFMKEKSNGRPAKVELFARMTNELVYRYSKMLPDMTKEPDEIEIIQWCVDNSLIQQALTLCTEWLPEYLIEHGVIYTDVLDVQQHCDNKKSMGDNAKKHFIKSFVTQSPNGKEIDNSAAKKAIKDLINGNNGTKAVKFALPVNFASGFSVLMQNMPDSLIKWQNRIPVKSMPMRKIIEKAQKDGYSMNMGELRSALHKWANKEFGFFMKLGLSLPAKKWQYEEQNGPLRTSAQAPKLWVEQHSLNAESISRNMLHGNVIQSDLTIEEALEYIRGYTYIKADLRNNINHANGNIKLNKVKNELNEYLTLLRRIRDHKHTLVGLWAEDTKEATE